MVGNLLGGQVEGWSGVFMGMCVVTSVKIYCVNECRRYCLMGRPTSC